MIYNFDEIIDRNGTDSLKYDERDKAFGDGSVLPLWVADMDFRAAKPIQDACRARAEHGIFGYVAKSESFFDAARAFALRRHGWEIEPGTIAIAPGVVPSLSELVREFTAPGDRVLIQTPVYPEFYDVIECWEGREVLESPLICNEDGSYDMDFADFEEKLRQGPKLFLLCNPQNPVGRIWRREELERLCSLCVRYGVPVVSDEIHGDLELFGKQYVPVGTLSEAIRANTIVCFSATKTFNLAGLQTNCTVFQRKDWQKRFERSWKNYEIHRNNCFGMAAMRAAWQEGDEWLTQLCAYLSDNVTFVHDYLEANIPQIHMHLPEATYLCWLDCRELGLTGDALGRFFVEKAHVGLSDGRGFQRGLEGYLRLNAACPRSVLQTALEQIKAAIAAR
ncbi:MAG: MalY/PatB family protein [Oscillospiraceae bacterium]|nr:MalY/PatB family protein [Oscillospiraceae bacterium]